MFCRHKFGKVEDGYQYCEKCGKAFVVSCSHRWQSVQEVIMKQWGVPSGKIIVQQCTRCGEIQKIDVGDTKGWWG